MPEYNLRRRSGRMSEQNLRKKPDGFSEYMLGKMLDGMSGICQILSDKKSDSMPDKKNNSIHVI